MKHISFIAAALAALVFSSCQNGPTEDLTSYYKVYNNNATGIQEILGFSEDMSSTLAVYAKTTDAGVPDKLTVTFKVDGSYVDLYNESEGKSLSILPASAWSFTKPEATVRAMYRKSDNAEIAITYSEDLQPDTEYVLPVTIASIEGSSDAHLVASSVVYFYVKTAKANMGNGTKEKPFLMKSADDLKTLKTILPNAASADAPITYVKLNNDIDLAGVAWEPFSVIVDGTPELKKVDFDGNGKTISNLNCEGSNASFFGYAIGSVHDLTFVNANIKSTNQAGVVAANAGYSSALAPVTITNVRVKNSQVLAMANGGGGLVGNFQQGTLSRCSFDGTVSGTNNYIGGIVGYLNKNGGDGVKVSNCIVTGKVIEDGGITAGHQRYGGIAGGINGEHQVIEYCICTAEVISGTGTGGIVGMAHYDSSSASACLGHGNTVKCCIAWSPKVYARKVKQNNYSPGAIIGYASVDGNYIDCVRRADMEFVQNVEINATDSSFPVNYISLVDQENSDKDHPLTVGIDCDHSSKHISPYHGKAAAKDETASQVAKRLGWSEEIWNLSGDIPALK